MFAARRVDHPIIAALNSGSTIICRRPCAAGS
jgi:hypothetical protein